MGRVRTKTVKRAARKLLERHYQKLTHDFHINKRILSQVAKVPTKKLRNKIAGYATHLYKRTQKKSVKGISLKVQEQQRERRLDWDPKVSEIELSKVGIDHFTSEMIKKRMGEDFYDKITQNLQIKAVEVKGDYKKRTDRRNNRDRRGPRPQKTEKKDEQGEQMVQEGEEGKRQPRKRPIKEEAKDKEEASKKVTKKEQPVKQTTAAQGKRRGNR